MRQYLVTAGLVMVIALLSHCGSAPAIQNIPADKWKEVLGPSQGDLPAREMQLAWQDSTLWLSDLDAAIGHARSEGMPLFVTMRCLPCKQCADFDKDVLEADGDLLRVLKRFVTVRLTDIKNVDLRMFPISEFQDLDLSWWGWFLSPEGQIYSVYGGRDHISDTTRMSVPSLIATCYRVLSHHYDPRRKAWDIDLPAPVLEGAAYTSVDLPGWASWYDKGHKEEKKQTCLHCHQAAEILRQPRIDAKRFDKLTDFDMWPLPENVGLVLNRDHGLLVDSVIPNSAAHQAGMKARDVLGSGDDLRLFSQADFMGVLHRGPSGAGSVHVRWWRDGEVQDGELHVEAGWRATKLSWRKSVQEANLGAHWGCWPLEVGEDVRAKFDIPDDAMAIRPWFGPTPSGPAYAAGLRYDHVVTAIDEVNPNIYGREFQVWFRLRYEPGDTVALTALDGKGRKKIISYAVW